jgi:ankyrin repeat protein
MWVWCQLSSSLNGTDVITQEQQTPLHIASRLGNVDIVVLLLQSGAQVDAVTKGGT